MALPVLYARPLHRFGDRTKQPYLTANAGRLGAAIWKERFATERQRTAHYDNMAQLCGTERTKTVCRLYVRTPKEVIRTNKKRGVRQTRREVGQTKKEMPATAERLAQYPKGCSDTQKRNMHKGDTRRINRANTCILKLRKLNIHIIING